MSLSDDAEIEAAHPARAQHGYTSMLQSLQGEGLMPFRLDGEEGEETEEEIEPAAEHGDEGDLFGLVSDAEIDAARPPDQRPHGYTTLLNSLDETGPAPSRLKAARLSDRGGVIERDRGQVRGIAADRFRGADRLRHRPDGGLGRYRCRATALRPPLTTPLPKAIPASFVIWTPSGSSPSLYRGCRHRYAIPGGSGRRDRAG